MVTKRQLGAIFGLVGTVGVIGVLALDLVRGKPVSHIQLGIIGGCLALALVGAALLPLGDRPV
jgi:hypothetical protein